MKRVFPIITIIAFIIVILAGVAIWFIVRS